MGKAGGWLGQLAIGKAGWMPGAIGNGQGWLDAWGAIGKQPTTNNHQLERSDIPLSRKSSCTDVGRTRLDFLERDNNWSEATSRSLENLLVRT
jgi:hypothetical protein